ncbi:MAG TPA: ATP-binding protein [Acidimicrobiales bacterium]|nr:ATP-binding protein [Acidimicrobiales bacterium]
MSSSTAQFQFAAEFVMFLAGTAGVALVLLRGELLTRPVWARSALGLGLAALGAGAFLSGSLLVDQDTAVSQGMRVAGVLTTALGTVAWTGSRSARRLLWVGLGLITASLTVQAASATPTAGVEVLFNSLLGLGAAGIVAAVLAASRRSIAARVAASAAGTLLLVVLVLSVALSTVLASTIEDEAIRRLDSRASTEAALLRSRTEEVLGRADLAARYLASEQFDGQLLFDLAGEPRPSPVIDQRLRDVAGLFPTAPVALAYLAPSRFLIGRAGIESGSIAELSGSRVLREALSDSGSRSSVDVVGKKSVILAAAPVVGPGSQGSPLLGAVLASTPLDDSFLSARAADDQSLSLALVARTGALALIGPQPDNDDVGEAVNLVLTDGRPATLVTNDRYTAVRAVPASDGRPIVALVASTPTTLVAQTRDSLFRTLFLIALGGTLLALLLASVVGERIGGGLRRLTNAAEGIQSGDLTVRSGLHTDDELGVLGQAFDSMATSIEGQTVALQEAADDETRLRNRLEAVVAGMGEALVAVDSRGRVTDFNQAAEELVGTTAARARGRFVDEVVTVRADDGTDLGKRLRKPSPARWSAIGSVVQRDRTVVPVALSAGALRGAGAELAGNVFVLRDLRREREVERMKTEFLSRVGHELRTPLTGIIGFSEILANRDVPAASAKQWHRDILDSSRKLLRIVEMLEFFASSGAGRMMLRRESLHIRTVVDDEVGWWQERLDPPWSIDRKLPRTVPLVLADRHWVKQSLHELIDNAVKFSPDGGKVVVSVSVVTRDRVRGVELSVADKGKGMSADEVAEAFGEFAQGDTSDTRHFGGLGLGLPLVKRVAETHGGSVEVTSRAGRGTTVTMFLPLTET